MKDYATISNTVGTFPNVVSQNASGLGATDGTPYIAQVIDDLWGFSQAIMQHAGLTPDGVTESASASQRLTALQRICGGPGEVVGYMGDPADLVTNNIRLLQLAGQDILCSSYPDLVDAVWVGPDPANANFPWFFKRDGVGGPRDENGSHLKLCLSQGMALRGLDNSGVWDPDRTGTYDGLGGIQEWGIVKHSHEVVRFTPPSTITDIYVYQLVSAGTPNFWGLQNGINPDQLRADEDAIQSSYITLSPHLNENETRMNNIAVHWCIRY
jgi:hypothetical protein